MVKIPVERQDGGGMRLYDGKYPAVTDVIGVVEKRFIADWRKRVGDREADRIMNNAKVFGTRVHTVAEALAKTHGTGETVEVPPEMVPFARAIRDFLNAWVEEIVATELRLVSHEYGFGGTTDLVARVREERGGGIAVFDLKTSRQLSREHGLQTAAYKILARENGHDVTRRFAVRIKKEEGAHGKFHCREFEDHEGDEEGFLAILRFYYWLHNTRLANLQA
jgi:hypothetical protein